MNLPSLTSPARAVARWLTAPLLPDDYLELFNPLSSRRETRARVRAVQVETPDAVTLVLRAGHGWVGHRAGQYVRLGVDVDGVRQWRTYSITSVGGSGDDTVTVTVKAVPGGLVSRYLVHRIAPGAVVRLEGPLGDFVLPDPPPPRLLFLTAGSGITPVMGMLRTLSATGCRSHMVLVHAARRADEVIFGPEVRALADAWPALHLYERHTATAGRLRLAELPRICPDWPEREVFACGPAGMLDEAEAYWRAAGLADRLHVERFRPRIVATGGSGGTVRFTRAGRMVVADGSTSLLAAGESAGVLMPSGCRMGICHSCVASLRSGQVRDLRTGDIHGDAVGVIQTCVSAAAGPVEIDL
jgi:stearoyl-CoA 9-desaturase NADPH oxidoreductase